MSEKPIIGREEEADNGGKKYALPYGIAKGLGLSTVGMTPSQVWAMLSGYGMKPKEEYEKYYDDLEKKAKKEITGETYEIVKAVEKFDDEPSSNSEVFGEEAYTNERKSKALNTSDPLDFDKMARVPTYKVWQKMSYEEKFAVVDYTGGYSKYNEPLRGIEYGTSVFKGVGNVDLENIGVNYGGYKKGQIKKQIDAMTNAIENCSYDSDVILRRGCNFTGMDKFFNGVTEAKLQTASQEELTALLTGQTFIDHGFTSCGSTKNKGFTGKDIQFSIYAPKGTKMMYVEPVSHYGAQYGTEWKGQEQSYFNYEDETVIQRGTSYRVTKVERLKGGKLYIQMEVVGQQNFKGEKQ